MMKAIGIRRTLENEWKILDCLYLFSLIFYIFIEMLIKQEIKDILFIAFLTFATLFLNYRQKQLYFMMTDDEVGKKFFSSIYKNGEQDKQICDIFLNRKNDLFALIFAVFFVIVVRLLVLQEDILIVKNAFSIYILCANLPTGLAIVRLIKYFKYTFIWIGKLNISDTSRPEENYLKKIRNYVLFTAVLYCTSSLSSILFTDFNINVMVYLYTFFAAILVIFIMLVTEASLTRKRKVESVRLYDELNKKIMAEANLIIDSDDYYSLEKIESYIRLKGLLHKERDSKLDFSRIISSIGMLFITIIPILLQWFLGLL